MYVLDIAQVFDLAEREHIDTVHSQGVIERVLSALADRVAKRLGIRHVRSTVEEPAFAGVCSTFDTKAGMAKRAVALLKEYDECGEGTTE